MRAARSANLTAYEIARPNGHIKEHHMELAKLRDLLVTVALDHSNMPVEEMLKNIANAMLHIAEAVADIQRRLPAD